MARATVVEIRPRTAREALFEIRRVIAAKSPVASQVADEVIRNLDAMAVDGLASRGIENFELSDQLADRLAEAHKVLREFQEVGRTGPRDYSAVAEQVAEVLALPPDLEEMVNRRIGQRA